jgi:hypothetical protein
MPNATVRANARTLPKTTNRRAILGGILVAGAGVTTALPAFAAVGTPTLSAVDRHVLDLWGHRATLKAIRDQIEAQFDAA